MNVRPIVRGIVIDHISTGKGLEIFRKLNLKKVKFPVVLLMNVESSRFGKKDVIKIENRIDLDMDMLAIIDDQLTINIIEEQNVTEKRKPSLPRQIVGLIKCDNPRCISNEDVYINAEFSLVNAEKKKYICDYCEEVMHLKNVRL